MDKAKDQFLCASQEQINSMIQLIPEDLQQNLNKQPTYRPLLSSLVRQEIACRLIAYFIFILFSENDNSYGRLSRAQHTNKWLKQKQLL